MSKDSEVVVMPLAELRKLTEAIERVRELHKKSSYGNHCPFCTDAIRDVDLDHWWHGYVNYPCPTIQALDGEQA